METLYNKAKNINLLAMDVDGILSDGKLYFSNSGEELKTFSTLDGLGIKLLLQSGIQVAIITGRKSEIVAMRAKQLGIRHVAQGRDDKLVALTELSEDLHIPIQQTAYIGDDLPDLSAVIAAGLGMTVPNGHGELKKYADGITTRAGGAGAVRELCELILKAQGKLADIYAGYRDLG